MHVRAIASLQAQVAARVFSSWMRIRTRISKFGLLKGKKNWLIKDCETQVSILAVSWRQDCLHLACSS